MPCAADVRDRGPAPSLQFDDITIAFGHGPSRTPAVEDFSLDCLPNTFTVLVGSNGCGKTSLVRTAAGLMSAESGRVLHNGSVVTEPDPRRWLIQQRSNLLPWLTLEANLRFARKCAQSPAGLPIADALALVGLSGKSSLRPGQLSGGMVQRAELARALVVAPDVLLLDEPFGAIDALSRLNLQRELLGIVEQWRATCVMVTHDIAEAVYLADQVVLLGGRPGRVLSVIALPARERTDAARRSGPAFQDMCRHIEEVLAAGERSAGDAPHLEPPRPGSWRRWRRRDNPRA
jgi:NitT/TauT family transport system ATP-binding protein